MRVTSGSDSLRSRWRFSRVSLRTLKACSSCSSRARCLARQTVGPPVKSNHCNRPPCSFTSSNFLKGSMHVFGDLPSFMRSWSWATSMICWSCSSHTWDQSRDHPCFAWCGLGGGSLAKTFSASTYTGSSGSRGSQRIGGRFAPKSLRCSGGSCARISSRLNTPTSIGSPYIARCRLPSGAVRGELCRSSPGKTLRRKRERK
mmetsp:Transcript_11993/g.50430  ORF Transcript_11993/g.50430 Transcript_11993/m.50430 type:complete len:202 (-) Transcript_11993:1941-2546(-)